MPAVADIVMLPAWLATVSGVVLGSEERPVPTATLIIARGDGFFGLASNGFRVSPVGTFRLGGFQPGTYFLM